ncbi:MAG: DegT/DnrJ/EryC1/StrS aminotransferase family protein [Nitrospira sp.]|nr:DegT/DnrJ/EryC1/StrS aminotransferase family protein [Nitrospira sp.]
MSRFLTKGVSTVRALHLKSDGKPPFPFSSSNVSFWYSGQVALWQGIHQLGLKKSDGVLVPAYSCGLEIDVLLSAGLQLEFYQINEDLTPDFEQLEVLCKPGVRVLYVTHYFGVSQPLLMLRNFATDHGLLLIEDNAHGLYSQDKNGQWLGREADCSIFSLRKKLPIPDGGALIMKRKFGDAGAKCPDCQSPPLKRVLWSGVLMACQELVYLLPGGIYQAITRRKVRKEAQQMDNTCEAGFDQSQANWSASRLTQWIIHHVNHSHIRESRRRNFQVLDKCFRGGKATRKLLGPLRIGCCPWFYPVMADNPDGLVEFMLSQGIWACRFWAQEHPNIPLQKFPFERSLKRHLVVLPVHQGLSKEEMRRIGCVLNRWSERTPRISVQDR